MSITADEHRARVCRRAGNVHSWLAAVYAERAQRLRPQMRGPERADMCESHAAAHRLSARDEYAAARRIEAGILDAAF